MDHAVALVETYLRVNGYLTVTEFPVIDSIGGSYRATTDLDVLAFRFPGAGARWSRQADGNRHVDPELAVPVDAADMIIAEVKEGKATLNHAGADPQVLQAALARFGCCKTHDAEAAVRELIRRGRAQTHCGHTVRLVVFAALAEGSHPHFQFVSLAHVAQFLHDYICEHWEAVRAAQFKDPVFGLFVALEKAQRARRALFSIQGGANAQSC
jgi:hypothetical protein